MFLSYCFLSSEDKGNRGVNRAGLWPSLSGGGGGGGFNDGNFTGEMTRERRGGVWLKNKAEKQAVWPQLHVRPSSSGFPRVCTAPSGIWLCTGSHSHTDTLRSSLHECMFLHMHLNMHTLAKWFRDIRAALCLFTLAHLFPNQVSSKIYTADSHINIALCWGEVFIAYDSLLYIFLISKYFKL